MFEIEVLGDGRIRLAGRLDAAEADRARTALRAVSGPATMDFEHLEYISSAGLGVIVESYKRLHDAGHSLKLVRLKPRIRTIFTYAGLDKVLTIE